MHDAQVLQAGHGQRLPLGISPGHGHLGQGGKHADAKQYDNVTYDEVLEKHLGVMDATAIALARDNALPIIVFSLDEPGGFRGILAGEGTYTRVQG